MRNWEEAIAGIALAVVFLSVVWGVIARYIAPQPAAWSNELATLCFAWLVFLGTAAGAKKRLHIGVDLITARLPQSVQRLLSILVSLFLAVALAYVVWLAVKLGQRSLDRPTPVMRLPSTIVHVAVVIGFGSMVLGYLLQAWHLVRHDDRRADD